MRSPGRAQRARRVGMSAGGARSVSRPTIVRIVFMDDIERVAIVDFIARQDAVFAAGLEECDRDHQGAGEFEGVVLGDGEIVRHF